MSDLEVELVAKLREAGWEVTTRDTVVEATHQVILSKWLFGSRRVRHSLSCRFDVATHTVHYKETAEEVAIGLPPLTLSFTTTHQQGLAVQETRRDTSFPVGGGEMGYAAVRQWLQSRCGTSGWKLELKIL